MIHPLHIALDHLVFSAGTSTVVISKNLSYWKSGWVDLKYLFKRPKQKLHLLQWNVRKGITLGGNKEISRLYSVSLDKRVDPNSGRLLDVA